MSDMEVSVGLRRKSCDHTATMFTRGMIGGDEISNEI